MRQFDKDKIMGNVVECTTEEQCKELVDWYLEEVNPEDTTWNYEPRDKYNIYGILVELIEWSYDNIVWYKDNDYKIIPFNEALLEQTGTQKENPVQEPKQVTQLFLNDEVTLSKEDFIKFAMEGYEFSCLSYTYFYDDSFDNPFRVDGVALQLHWQNINSKNKFKVVKSPYESAWQKYKCIKNGVTYFVETDNIHNVRAYIQCDFIQEISKEGN